MSKTLLVGNPLAKQENLESLHQQLSQSCQVVFEQFDRIPFVNLQKVSSIQFTPPFVFSHSPLSIQQYSKALLPNGTIQLSEPCVLDSGILLKLEKLSNSKLPIHTQQSLKSELIINGFVDIEMTSVPVQPNELSQLLEYWGEDTVLDIVKDCLFIVTVNAKKPNYEQSQGAKLSFKKKVKEPEPQPKVEQPKVWKISLDDDDDELENEDTLLDEQDLVVPPIQAPGDCSTRKKACKDCTCGRAEEEAQELSAQITIVPKKCYLGDAFRCSSCPYLGMPAFKPGEQVMLAGSLLKDDLDTAL